jgi:uncharacterized damage-inducible protein DinB
MTKDQAIFRITHTRQTLFESLQGICEADFTTPQVEGVWTIKDLLGHITAWEDACLIPLERFAEGGLFQSEVIPDHDVWNAAQASRRGEQSLAEILKEMNDVRQGLMAAVDRLNEAQWSQSVVLPWGEEATIANMLSGLAWHEEEHTKSIWSERRR